MKPTFYQWILITLTSALSINLYTRSIYRPTEKNVPSITICDSTDTPRYSITDSHLEQYPHFAFNVHELTKYTIPAVISYHTHHSRFLTKKRIDTMIDTLLNELFHHKKFFSDFTLLKSKNFNFDRCCGLLIAKCKNHPFVVKLFIERPETYFDPYSKGIESIAFFFMGGGANRHISGMARLLNLEKLKKKLEHLEQWKHTVTFPRKWFWLPKNPRFMTFKGTNFTNTAIITNKIPEVFAIIADEIHCIESPTILKEEKIVTIMNLCNDLDTFLDAHYDNFIFKKNNHDRLTIHIIDTEHIPTMTGLKKKQYFNNYWEWYTHLITHCVKKMFFRTKKERRMDQSAPNELALT